MSMGVYLKKSIKINGNPLDLDPKQFYVTDMSLFTNSYFPALILFPSHFIPACLALKTICIHFCHPNDSGLLVP